MKQIFTNMYFIDGKNISNRDIFVSDGIICDEFEKDKDTKIIDCNGYVLVPSFVDLHAHFRDPGFTQKEDLKTGSLSALKGGYTTVNLMGNTKPTVSNPKVYEDIKKRAKDLDLIDIEQVYTITKDFDGKTLSHLDDIDSSVKFISDDGKGVNNDYIMYLAFKKAKEKNLNLTLHEEVMGLSKEDYDLAENIMTIRDCYLSYKLNQKVHFSHVSTKDAIRAIEFFKNLGANITCEVTPHHLYFSDRNDLRVNPPIRREEDRIELIEMIKRGIVDCISTDHAPHTKKDKLNGAPGYIGLETAFSICYESLVLSGNISLNHLIELMSTNPSKILKINKGRIKKGYEADFTLIDLNDSFTYTEDMIASKSKNSPYIGKKLHGRILRVYKKGILEYEYNR